MSIRSFNKLIQGNGCIVTLSVLLAIGFAIGFLSSGFGPGRSSQTNNTQDVTVVKVGQLNITDQMIATEYSNLLQSKENQGGIAPGPTSAEDQIVLYGSVLQDLINPGLALAEAQKHNLIFTDQQLIAADDSDIANQLVRLKKKLIENGIVSYTATNQEFDAALKKLEGKTTGEITAEDETQFKALLDDPSKRKYAIAQFADQLIPGMLASQLHPTEAGVKNSYVTISAKRILFTGSDANAQAAKVLQMAKTGSNFDALVNKYSKDIPPKGQLPAATPISITHDKLVTDPMSQLLLLKPGDISSPLDLSEGVAIYKVLAIKPSVPVDWDKKSADYIKQYAIAKAQAQYATDMKELNTGGTIQWESNGYKSLYETYQLLSSKDQTDPVNLPKWKSIQSEAATAMLDTKDTIGAQPAALAQYAAGSILYSVANATEKKAMLSDYMQVLSAVSKFADSSTLELRIADLMAQTKNGDGVAGALAQAAQMNIDFTPVGQRIDAQIQGSASRYFDDGVLNRNQIKQVTTALAQWQANKKLQDDQKAQALKSQQAGLAAQAKAEAQDKAAAEQARKQAIQDEKNAPKGPESRTQFNSNQPKTGSAPSTTGGSTTGSPLTGATSGKP